MEMESSDCDSSFFEQKNIFIALTYKCNAFCRKCITRYNRFRNQSMQRSDCRRLAELLIANHFSGIINLGSGESLLYDELPTFVERVLSELPQVRFRILTNGMLFSSRLPAFFFSPRIIWGITLDGFCNADLQHLQQGVDVETVKHNIISVCKAGFASNLYLNYTLNKQNIRSLKAYIDFANEIGVPKIYVTEMKIFKGFKDLDRYRLSQEDKNAVISLRQYAEKMPFKVVSFDTERDLAHRKNCLQLKGRISPIIDLDCSLTFCSGQEDRFLGSIFEADTLTKWSALLKKLQADNTLAAKWCSRCFSNMEADGYFSVPLSLNPYLWERCHVL